MTGYGWNLYISELWKWNNQLIYASWAYKSEITIKLFLPITEYIRLSACGLWQQNVEIMLGKEANKWCWIYEQTGKAMPKEKKSNKIDEW